MMPCLQPLLLTGLLAFSPAVALTGSEKDHHLQEALSTLNLSAEEIHRIAELEDDSSEELSVLPRVMQSFFLDKCSFERLLIILTTVINERTSVEQRENPEINDLELWGVQGHVQR